MCLFFMRYIKVSGCIGAQSQAFKQLYRHRAGAGKRVAVTVSNILGLKTGYPAITPAIFKGDCHEPDYL